MLERSAHRPPLLSLYQACIIRRWIMRSLLSSAALLIVALAGNGYAQESKKQADKAEITKATYMVTGLH